MADIKSIADAAGVLYRGRIELPVAVGQALDQYGITDRFERGVLYKAICSELGKRGNWKKEMVRKEKGKPEQMVLPFYPSVRREIAGRKRG